jgi:hypothetical protein
MRRVTFFFTFAAGHFVLCLGLFTALWVVAERSASHDGSGPIVRGLDFVMHVLWFPVVSLMSQPPAVLRSLGTAGKYLPFVVNSFVWAAVLTAVLTVWRRRRRAG